MNELTMLNNICEDKPGTITIRINHGNTIQHRIFFPNGYGASIIKGYGTYGVELAVTDHHGHLDYSTPITSDVLGYLDEAELSKALRDISDLPDNPNVISDEDRTTYIYSLMTGAEL